MDPTQCSSEHCLLMVVDQETFKNGDGGMNRVVSEVGDGQIPPLTRLLENGRKVKVLEYCTAFERMVVSMVRKIWPEGRYCVCIWSSE